MDRIQSTYLFNPSVNAGKMIFLCGPRQVGKTTFVRDRLALQETPYLYFNWDDPFVRREYIKNPHFLKEYLSRTSLNFPLAGFDEIHKNRNWKNILKGIYDVMKDDVQLMVTGSARLDLFRKSGDSLVGRYFSYTMLPLGLVEAAGEFTSVSRDDSFFVNPRGSRLLERLHDIPAQKFKDAYAHWLHFGGFPEPFVRSRESFSLRWRRDYRALLCHEDLRDLTRIHDLRGIEQLMLVFPERIGSPLSNNSLREDLQVTVPTIKNWISAFEKIFLVFPLLPWSKKIARAITKERKYYFYDWTMVPDKGACFENAVAVSLLRAVSRWNELGAGAYEVFYVRMQYGHEMDFLLVKNGKPAALFEAKLSDTELSRASHYFCDIFKIPFFQIVGADIKPEEYPGQKFVVPAWRFLVLLG